MRLPVLWIDIGKVAGASLFSSFIRLDGARNQHQTNEVKPI